MTQMLMPREYIGDGIYVEVDRFGDMILATYVGKKPARLVLTAASQVRLVECIERMVEQKQKS